MKEVDSLRLTLLSKLDCKFYTLSMEWTSQNTFGVMQQIILEEQLRFMFMPITCFFSLLVLRDIPCFLCWISLLDFLLFHIPLFGKFVLPFFLMHLMSYKEYR